ncbi:MAG: cell wall-binding repeat-containing protein [Acidimicrobiales bacterium]
MLLRPMGWDRWRPASLRLGLGLTTATALGLALGLALGPAAPAVAAGSLAATAGVVPAAPRLLDHGPDPAPAGVDVKRRDLLAMGPRRSAPGDVPDGDSTGTAPAWGQVRCFGDGQDGNRVQDVYAVPDGQEDRYSSVAPMIRRWSAYVDWTFSTSAMETGGDRHVRFVTGPDCQPVVAQVHLPSSAFATFADTTKALQDRGFDHGDRKYLVWADTHVLCGQAEQYLDDTSASDNWNNGGHPMVARVDAGCWGMPAAAEAHELMHTLGGVQLSAPHSTGHGHCTDTADRMCYADAPDVTMVSMCPASHADLFDCSHDDYFSTSPRAGGYLASHWNAASSSFLEPASPIEIDPISGPDRYGTAASAALAAFPQGATHAVLARGEDYSDALAGSYLAGAEAGPVLLTTGDHLHPATVDAFAKLGVTSVDVLGGPGAIADAVVADLTSRGLSVRRVAGDDRFSTAAAVAQAAASAGGDGGVGSLGSDGRTALVASGQSFADALAAGPLSWVRHLPLLLGTQAGLPDVTLGALKSLGIQHVVLVGGSAALGPAVEGAVTGAGMSVSRLAGDTRAGTATAIADLELTLGWSSTEAELARGDQFADALAASGTAGHLGPSPLLLSAGPASLGTPTQDWISRHPSLRRLRVLGGGPVNPGGH